MLSARLIEPERVFLQWESLAGDTFSVYRSQVEHEGFELLIQNVTTSTYTDATVHFDDDAVRYFYKVKGLSSAGAVVSESVPVCVMYNQQDRIAFKIMYEYDVVLRVMANPFLHLFVRKRVDERCPTCWNPVTKKVRFADCNQCQGSGLVVGYYSSVPIRVSADVSQFAWNPDMFDSNKVNISQIGVWTMPTPVIRPGDILADVMGHRFIVSICIPHTKSQYVIRQQLQLLPLDQGHPSYLLVPDTEVS